MQKKLISIIVPVYNVEDYLRRCLDSIINQTYKNLEIILVDDGSTDKSGKICDEYKAKDKRIIVIHQKNQGLSAARNAGLDIFKGEYVSFIDSDDYVDLRFIELLLDNLIKNKADISICSVVQIYRNRKKYLAHYSFKDTCFKSEEFLRLAIPCSVWNKLFAKKLFVHLRFPVGKFYEDSFIYFDLIYKSNRIVSSSKTLYFYCLRDNSITQSKSTQFYLDLFEAKEKGIKFILDNKLSDDILNNWFAECYFFFIVCYKEINKKKEMAKKQNLVNSYNRIVTMVFDRLNLSNKIRATFPFLLDFIKPIIKFMFYPIFIIIRKHKDSVFKNNK